MPVQSLPLFYHGGDGHSIYGGGEVLLRPYTTFTSGSMPLKSEAGWMQGDHTTLTLTQLLFGTVPLGGLPLLSG